MTTPADIHRALAEGRAMDALRALRLALEYPQDPGPLGPWMEALSAVSRAHEVEELADHAAEAATRPDDPEALYEVGWGLVEGKLYGAAATVLSRALALRPHEPAIVRELLAAFENAGMNAAARDLLAGETELRANDFGVRYYYAFHAVLAGDLATGRAAAAELAPEGDTEKALAARIKDMLARADAVSEVTPLDTGDLRGWHYVLTGGLLLHTSPYGEASMHGRYAFLQASEALCLEGILRLRRLLGFLRLEPKALVVLPDRDSLIFAEAAAKLLRLPLVPWVSGTKEKGLVVAYDLGAADVEVRQELAQRRPGQLLWSQTLSWTEPVGLTPEFVGHLHQLVKPPWGARLVRDPETGKTETVPPSTGSVPELAARILAANVEDLPGQSALDALAQAGDVPAASWRKRGGAREPLWFMGPVKSARFY